MVVPVRSIRLMLLLIILYYYCKHGNTSRAFNTGRNLLKSINMISVIIV